MPFTNYRDIPLGEYLSYGGKSYHIFSGLCLSDITIRMGGGSFHDCPFDVSLPVVHSLTDPCGILCMGGELLDKKIVRLLFERGITGRKMGKIRTVV